MSGSRPEADVVTRSTGIGLVAVGRPEGIDLGGDPVDQLLVRRTEVRPGRGRCVVARPSPAADGRLEKYLGSLNAWPMRLEPMVRPSAVTMNEPLAWCGKATWATAVTTSG